LVAHPNGEGELMNKVLLALACGVVMVVAGCGGKDKTAERKTACTKASAALSHFQEVGREVGLNVRKAANDKRIVASAAALRERVEELQQLTTAKERQQLGGLTHALVRLEKLFGALAVRDLAAAHRYDQESGTTLDTTKLMAICKTFS
jgi:hypothetical protein